MTTRQENAQKTRQKLLDVTHQLIKQKGFYKLGVADITEKAGVATGTFYVYFRHKEEIVLEICKGLFKETKLKLEKNKDSDITKRLSLYFDCFIKEVQGYQIHIVREWIKGIIEKNDENESMGKIKWQYDFEILKDIFLNAIKDKELIPEMPVDTICKIILCEIYGMLTVWCMSDGNFNPQKMVKEFSEIQLKAILDKYLI